MKHFSTHLPARALLNRFAFTLSRDAFELAVDFSLPRKGVVALLGPSGSGKSSLLRVVSGLEPAARGTITVSGKRWLDSDKGVRLTPQVRRVGMVFQDYALFEHMDAAANIGFGVPRAERPGAVSYWVDALSLDGLEHRLPRQLSGGQRQRVALARALASEPEMLLLDEPLSAVDVHLRQRLRVQLQAVFMGLNKPVLLVSHDLEEARHLADYVGVIVNGRLHRLAGTREAFENPGTIEAARVMGWRNLLGVSVIDGSRISGSWGALNLHRELDLETFALGIRPEKVGIVGKGEGDLSAEIVRITELDGMREVQCRLLDDMPFFVQRSWNDPLPAPGTTVGLKLPRQHLVSLVEGEGATPSRLAALVDMPNDAESMYPETFKRATQSSAHRDVVVRFRS